MADGTRTYHNPRIAWGLARAVVGVVICADAVVVVLNVWSAQAGAFRTGLAVALLAAVLSIQLFHFSRNGARLRSTLSYVLLGTQACLAYLPFLIFGHYWDGVPSFLAGSLLLTLPAIPAAAGFTLVVGSVTLIQALQPGTLFDVLYIPVTVATFGLEVYLLTRLAGLVGELDEARDELAQLAVSQERLRFARDLHDLLGLSLSAITLKGELAHRLMYKYPAQAKQELGEILDIARRALADVRSVATGYQELSLEQECNSAESVLSASNVQVDMVTDYADLPALERTMLGAVLREGVTNVLRHSKAEHCEIVIRQTDGAVSMDIVNDGLIDESIPVGGQGGSGTHNVSERVAALHGSVTAGPEDGGQSYRLHVQIPLPTRDRLPAKVRRSIKIHPPADRELDSDSDIEADSSIDGWSTRTLITLVFLGMSISASIHLVSLTSDFWKIVSGLGYLAALLALQLAYANRTYTRQRSAQDYALLFVQACLIYLPVLELGSAWVSLPGFLVGCALLVLRPVAAWTVLAASIGFTIWHFASVIPEDAAASAANVLITGLVVFGVSSLSRLVSELNATRSELATMAIAKERLLFTQDLHELLGRSLSAISLNGELTQRLLDRNPDRAMEELTEILHLARQALADVRSVASGYRELSLDDESRSASSVLTAADVRVRMDLQYGELPVLARTVLAVALREGVTNILRHSKAEHCEITIQRAEDRVYLDIVNDGVTEPMTLDDEDDIDGEPAMGGLHALTERLHRIDGELTTQLEDDGRFRMRASVPILHAQ